MLPIKFKLPSLPSSMNGLYNIVPYYSQKRIEVQMKQDVRLWRTEMKGYVPPGMVEARPLSMDMVFSGNWFTKAGKVRVIDLPNLEKVVIDLVAEKLGFNDCYVWEKRARKITGDPGVEITLDYIPMEGDSHGFGPVN